MNEVITINNVQLPIKEFNNERVITFKDMDLLHERRPGAAKKNFHNNRDKFIENEDYYMITLKQFRKLYPHSYDSNRGNPDLNIILLTEMGYLMLVKTFSDQLAWQVQRALVNNYFRFKQASRAQVDPLSNFDAMRSIIDVLEETYKEAMNIQSRLRSIEDRVVQLEDTYSDINLKSLPAPTLATDLLKASDIAHQLKLYTVKGLPHSKIIGAIAKKLGFKTNIKNYYEDDYIVILKEGENELSLTWQVYYKPKGADLIIDWFESNKKDIYYESRFKKNSKYGKAGDIREVGYRVGGVNWAISL